MKITPSFLAVFLCGLILSAGVHAEVPLYKFDAYLLDLDQDGVEDIALVPRVRWVPVMAVLIPVNKSTYWLKGLEGGLFAAPESWAGVLPSDMPEPLNYVMEDLTGNGLKDVIIQSSSPLNASIFLTQDVKGWLTLKQ